MNQFSRNKHLYTVKLSATSTVLLNASGNPPEPRNETPTGQSELSN